MKLIPKDRQHLPRALEDLAPLLVGSVQLVEAVHTHEKLPTGEAWRNDGQILLQKGVHHLWSMATVGDGIELPIKSENNYYVDHSSIGVLGRAAFEALVLFNFIFLDGVPDEQRLRHDVWILAASLNRLKLQGYADFTDVIGPIRDADASRVNELRKRIKENALFKALPPNVQKNALENEGIRLGLSWTDIAERAGLPRIYAADMYKHMSQYTHSSAISAWQIRDSYEDAGGPILAATAISFCSLLLAEVLQRYCDCHPSALRALEDNSKLVQCLAQFRLRRDILRELKPVFSSE